MNIERHNRERFERVYGTGDRREYPDLWFVHFLRRYVLERCRVARALVVGSGDGPEVFALTRVGARVSAIDIAPSAVARLRRFAATEGVSHAVDARVGDQCALGVEPATYDLAVSWSVISYLDADQGQRAIAEIRRALRPGGYFIGLLESLDHSGPTLPGAEALGRNTFAIPEDAPTLGGVVMTYYDRAAVEDALAAFETPAVAHRIVDLPPDGAGHRVGQWMFCARKRS